MKKWAIAKQFCGPYLVVYDDRYQRYATIRPLKHGGWSWIVHLRKFRHGTQNTLEEAITNVKGVLTMAAQYEIVEMSPEVIAEIDRMKSKSDVPAGKSLYCHNCSESSVDFQGTCFDCKAEFRADGDPQPKPKEDDAHHV